MFILGCVVVAVVIYLKVMSKWYDEPFTPLIAIPYLCICVWMLGGVVVRMVGMIGQ